MNTQPWKRAAGDFTRVCRSASRDERLRRPLLLFVTPAPLKYINLNVWKIKNGDLLRVTIVLGIKMQMIFYKELPKELLCLAARFTQPTQGFSSCCTLWYLLIDSRDASRSLWTDKSWKVHDTGEQEKSGAKKLDEDDDFIAPDLVSFRDWIKCFPWFVVLGNPI